MIAKLSLCAAIVFFGEITGNPLQPQTEPQQVQLIPIEQAIIDATNAERARYGLQPLAVCPELLKSARAHATWMTVNRTLQHTRQAVAENIAMGQRNHVEAVADWMRSAGHRANILNASYRRMGAAAYRTDGGTVYWCQQFMW